MTTSPQPERSVLDRARAAALWARDTGLGGTGFLIVLGVALAGWSASFIGLHKFGVDHMQFSNSSAWLVPLTFDGAPAGLTIVVMRASTHGRSALAWRLLIIAFTALSSWINYVHIDDTFGRYVASFMPPSAVIVFEGLMSEARKAAERRRNGVVPRVHPLRWFFDREGTLALYRNRVLGVPVPADMRAVAASPAKPLPVRATATAATASPSSANASPTGASPAKTASATPVAASPSSITAANAAPANLPAPNSTPAAASPGSANSQQPATPATGSQPAPAATASRPATGTDQRDLDDVADAYRKLAAELGRTPSDAKLAEALGVGRSRAQQLRTAAIEAGHTDLAKPLRAAS